MSKYPAVNVKVARAISGLFGSPEDSDCVVVFCQALPEAQPDGSDEEGAPLPKKRRVDSSIFGEPLPAHQFVLRYASERFGSEPCAAVAGLLQDQSPGGNCVELRVPLGSEGEVPSARAAITFAYTSRVAAQGVCDALKVRRQADYLQMEGCQTTCDTHVKKLLQGGGSNGSTARGANSGGAAGADGSSSASGGCVGVAAALELYASKLLWPDPDQDAGFASVLTAAKQAIVRHFGDAPSTLGRPSLRAQLLELPAEALEALLESDDFGTDTESSVLLLLATWMKENYGSADEATHKRLCSHVRLAQLSRPYLSFVLPALAADYETGAQPPAGWFPVSVTDAAFVAHFAAASEAERASLKTMGSRDYQSAPYSATRRRQCHPESFITFKFHVPQQELQQGLAALQPNQKYSLPIAMEDDQEPIADGLLWRPQIQYKHGAASAGVYLCCALPDAYDVPGSRLSSASSPQVLASANAEVLLQRMLRNSLLSMTFPFGRSTAFVHTGGRLGRSNALPLRPPSADGDPLAPWVEYLIGGRLTGSLTLLRSSQGEPVQRKVCTVEKIRKKGCTLGGDRRPGGWLARAAEEEGAGAS